MTSKLLGKYAVDIFFISISLVLIISIIQSANIIDIVYFGCVVYYYVRIKLYRWNNCN